jgi:transcriptional regulator with XRE-family HTH domain
MAKTIYRTEYRELIAQLRDLREKHALAQAELARLLGWPQQRVSQMERGVRRLDVVEYLELAGHLGLSTMDALALAERCLSKRK